MLRAFSGTAMRSCALLSAVALAIIGGAVQAQVVRDGTVGPGPEVQPGIFEVPGGFAYDITADLGEQSGGNLFHSFDQFSLRTDPSFGVENALFSDFGSAGGIEHIIARVTGENQSRINGTIASSVPGASLYLVNPQGVRFGPNARLSIPGSFHVGTGEVLRLADGGLVHAADPSASMLTSAPPAAFGFLGAEPNEIALTGSILELPGSDAPGSMTLAAGDLLVRDGAQLTAAGGGLVLASVASPGEVPTDLLLRGTGPAFPERFGDIAIDFSTLAVSDPFAGRNAGQLVLFGDDISIGPGTQLLADDAPDPDTGQPQGGPFGGFIAIRADGRFAIDGPARLSVSAQDAGLLSVRAPEARLVGAQLFAENFRAPPRERTTIDLEVAGTLSLVTSDLISTTFGESRAGDIALRAARLEMSGNSVIASSTRFDSTLFGEEDPLPVFGAGGRVAVEVDELLIADRSQIVTLSNTTAAAGRIDVSVTGDARILGEPGEPVPTGLASVTNLTGAGGDIRLSARNILLENAAITTESDPDFPALGELNGDAGSVALLAGDSIRLLDSIVSASSETSFGGTLVFEAANLIDARRSEVNTTVFGGDGTGGNIFWDPTFIVLDRTPLTAKAQFGDGGNIVLTANFLFRSPETPLPDASSQFGTQGVVEINAPDTSIAGELASLPQSTLDASQLLRSPCAANRATAGAGSLVLEGGDGTPPSPDHVLSVGSGRPATPRRAGALRELAGLAGERCAGALQARHLR